MKKVLFALIIVSASTFTLKEGKAQEATMLQDVCCASASECMHPIYGRVAESTLKAGSTCTVVDT